MKSKFKNGISNEHIWRLSKCIYETTKARKMNNLERYETSTTLHRFSVAMIENCTQNRPKDNLEIGRQYIYQSIVKNEITSLYMKFA